MNDNNSGKDDTRTDKPLHTHDYNLKKESYSCDICGRFKVVGNEECSRCISYGKKVEE